MAAERDQGVKVFVRPDGWFGLKKVESPHAPERDKGVTDLPANVLAMLPEVAGLVLDDWAIERGYTFACAARAWTVKGLVDAMERAAGSDPTAFGAFAPMPPDVLRRHVRAWAEPGLLRALNEVATELAWIA